jgi:DNA-directed RNA polymerase specialized sigma24 family protein
MEPAPELRHQVRALVADRHSPEARALFRTLAGYVERRTAACLRHRYADLVSEAEREEVVADVLFELMGGALVGFRGESTGELLSYVRRICDRHLWRAARRRIRERDTLDGEVGAEVRAWTAEVAPPDAWVELVPACPLDAADAAWLQALFASGSQADLARATGVSRAAVTQRLQRIRGRISRLDPQGQAAAEAWLEGEARRAEAAR